MTDYPKEIKSYFNMEGGAHELILFNDDVHAFDFVIAKLKVHCGHSELQAEQSAVITHHKVECSVLLVGEDRIDNATLTLSTEALEVDSRKVMG